MTSGTCVLVIGASTRGAAASVRRAGLIPVCLDLFGDSDLRLLAERVGLISDYPRSIPAEVAELLGDGLPGQLAGWLYTGGLENDPEIVAAIAGIVGKDVPCWSAMPDVLAKVRDPFWLQTTLQAAGLGLLACLRNPGPQMGRGTWLVKSLKSAGGLNTRYWQPGAALGDDDYLQQYCNGQPFSVVAFRSGKRMVPVGAAIPITGSVGIGPAAQMNADQSCSIPFLCPFLYKGSIAPVGLPREVWSLVEAMLSEIACRSGLDGGIGADFVWNSEGVWLLEINPRYTASMELYELALGCSLLGYGDGQAWANRRLLEPQSRDGQQVVAKRIIYAEREIALTQPLCRELSSPLDSLWEAPLMADVPQAPCMLPAGSPVCTVYGTGASAESAAAMANERGVRLMAELFG